MIRAFSTPRDRSRTLLLLATAIVLGLAAAAARLDDNPPGLLLALLSAAMFGAAFVHPWRSATSFRRLTYASVFGFLASVLLHNALSAAVSIPGLPPLARDILEGAGIAFFFTGLLICPALFLVGVVGASVTWMKQSRS